MAKTSGPVESSAARVDRLLTLEDFTSTNHTLGRFAAEKIVADLPDAAFEEHRVLMGTKLRAVQIAQSAIEYVATLDPAMEGLVEAAIDALRQVRFDDIEVTLADAENSHADSEVRLWVRSARGQVALVRGDTTEAAAHFVVAADYLEHEGADHESREQAMLFRSRAVGRLIQEADIFGGDGEWIDDAMKLCNENTKNRDTHPWNQGARQIDAGSAQRSAGRLKNGKEALDLFLAAAEAFRIASQRFGKNLFPVDWAAAQNNRGLAMADYCFRCKAITSQVAAADAWVLAEECYLSAMEVQLDAVESVPWAKTGINCAYLLVHRGRAERGESGQEFLQRAVERCRDAQQALLGETEADTWIDAQLILAEALLDLADVDQHNAQRHLSQAEVELTTAQDFLAGKDLPLRVVRLEQLMIRLRPQKGELDEE